MTIVELHPPSDLARDLVYVRQQLDEAETQGDALRARRLKSILQHLLRLARG